jgi:hypothetical protein
MNHKNTSNSFGGYYEISSKKISDLKRKFSLFESQSVNSFFYSQLNEEENTKKSKEQRTEDKTNRKEAKKGLDTASRILMDLKYSVESALNDPATKDLASVRKYAPEIDEFYKRMQEIKGMYNSNTSYPALKDEIAKFEEGVKELDKNYRADWDSDRAAKFETWKNRKELVEVQKILEEAEDLVAQAQEEARLADYKLFSSATKKNEPTKEGDKGSTTSTGEKGKNLDAKPVKSGQVDKENVKKVQEFIIQKLKGTAIAETSTYKTFAAAVPKAPGTFGPNTKKMIILLKKAMGMSDSSSDITEEFIKKLETENVKQAVKESRGVNLLFKSRMIREDIDPALFIEAEKEYSKPSEKPKDSAGSSSKGGESGKEEKKEDKKEEAPAKKSAKGTFPPDWYTTKADELFRAMHTGGTDEDKIYEIFGELETKNDFVLLWKAFGEREDKHNSSSGKKYNLHWWIREELSIQEIQKANEILREINVPENLLFKQYVVKGGKGELKVP